MIINKVYLGKMSFICFFYYYNYYISIIYILYLCYYGSNIHLMYKKYRFKKNLNEFYIKYNPEKINNIDVIVDKYIDNPKYILNALKEKYTI